MAPVVGLAGFVAIGQSSVVASAQLRESLAKFVSFAGKLKGDEKSEAQSFLDHFFRALGHDGVIEAGATYEFRIAKKPGSAQLELIQGEDAKPKGGKKFADLLWPERVLIEMKSRGQNLEKHYDQVFDYWTHIRPWPRIIHYFVAAIFTTEASKMLWIAAFNWASNSESDCCAVKPSSNAREKLAMTP